MSMHNASVLFSLKLSSTCYLGMVATLPAPSHFWTSGNSPGLFQASSDALNGQTRMMYLQLLIDSIKVDVPSSTIRNLLLSLVIA